MKSILISILSIVAGYASAGFNVTDERTKEVLTALDYGSEAKVCKETIESFTIEESCFFVVDGDLYFTPESYLYWINDPIVPDEGVVRFVSNYYVDDPDPVELEPIIVESLNQSLFLLDSKTKEKKDKKDKKKKNKEIGHGANNVSGNKISISIGNNNGNGGGGDRTCRSCHPGVHPGFGKDKP